MSEPTDQAIIKAWTLDQIRKEARTVKRTMDMPAEQYAREVGGPVEWAHATQLGGLQAQVGSLLFWLRQAGLVDDPE
jgi:hypothetical protein